MSADTYRAVVQRLFDEVWEQGNVAAIDEIFAPEYIDHGAPPGIPNRGPENHKRLLAMLRSAFPDINNTLEEVIVEGNKVAFRNTLRGTHQGPFMGIAPTGRSFVQLQMHVVHFSGDNKMVEHWAARDDLGMMQQLGVIPTPGQAPNY